MVKHEAVLPECQEVHDNMKFMFIAVCSFFVLYLSICTPLVISNVSDLKKEDQKIREERAEIVKARDKQFAEMNRRIDDGFLEIKIQLAQIQTSLLEH